MSDAFIEFLSKLELDDLERLDNLIEDGSHRDITDWIDSVTVLIAAGGHAHK